MPVLPLSEQYRAQLLERLDELIGVQEPLVVLKTRIFRANPERMRQLPSRDGRAFDDFLLEVIRFCELAAWADEPALIISLLEAFKPVWSDPALVEAIRKQGPFRCHPPGQPYWMCLVAAGLPLLGRRGTRAAAIAFDRRLSRGGKEGKRVLRVTGPNGSGKTHTLSFFRYLEAIQPLMLGIVDVDFAAQDLATQAISDGVSVELYLARQLEAQVRRRRASLLAAGTTDQFDLTELTGEDTRTPYEFSPLSIVQQRLRWVKELVGEFVEAVERIARIPDWWVVVFDNCEKAPPEAQEFVRRLIERVAGTETASAERADRGQLRVVLLGDSSGLLPHPVYSPHILVEDLAAQTLGAAEAKQYFDVLHRCRGIALNDAQQQELANESVRRAQELVNSSAAPLPWPRALAVAVIEKTLSLEAAAEEERNKP